MLSFCLHSLQPLFSSSGRPISAKRHWDDFALDSDEEDDFDWADEGANLTTSLCLCIKSSSERRWNWMQQLVNPQCTLVPSLTVLASATVCSVRAPTLGESKEQPAGCGASGYVCVADGAHFQPYAKRRRSGAVSFRTSSGTLENGAPLPRQLNVDCIVQHPDGHSIEMRPRVQVAPQVSGMGTRP